MDASLKGKGRMFNIAIWINLEKQENWKRKWNKDNKWIEWRGTYLQGDATKHSYECHDFHIILRRMIKF